MMANWTLVALATPLRQLEISKQQAWWGCLDPGSQLIAYSISGQSIVILFEAEKRKKGKIYQCFCFVAGVSFRPFHLFKNRPSFSMSVAVAPSCFSFVALPCVSSRVETLNISTKDVFGLLLRPSLENWQTHSEIFHNAFPPCTDVFDQVIKFENQQ